MHENKQLICNFLTLALQETRGAHDLITLNYDTEKEVVIGTFEGGGKKVCNVTADSGCAMIRDIMRQLGV